VALSACPDEFFRNLFSLAQPQNADPAGRRRRYPKLGLHQRIRCTPHLF